MYRTPFRSRREIDAAWAREAEDRIDAYERGAIGTSSAEEVFREIDQRANR